MQKNGSWLAVEECLFEPVCTTSGGRRGRPALPFTEKGRGAKQKSTAGLRRSACTPVLVIAAAPAVHQEGRRRKSHLLQEAGSPRRGSQLVARATATHDPHASYTKDEALALLVDLDLATAQYNSMRYNHRFPCLILLSNSQLFLILNSGMVTDPDINAITLVGTDIVYEARGTKNMNSVANYFVIVFLTEARKCVSLSWK